VDKTYESHQTVCEYRPETLYYTQRYCVSVPYQYKVLVPVYTPVCTFGCCP
jgi:hypothetical protein